MVLLGEEVVLAGEVEVAAPLVLVVPELAPFTLVEFAPVAGVALVPAVPVESDVAGMVPLCVELGEAVV